MDAEALIPRMRSLAERSSEDDATRLREEADHLERAVDECGGEGGIPKLVGAWARARRVWCDVTGEDLI